VSKSVNYNRGASLKILALRRDQTSCEAAVELSPGRGFASLGSWSVICWEPRSGDREWPSCRLPV